MPVKRSANKVSPKTILRGDKELSTNDYRNKINPEKSFLFKVLKLIMNITYFYKLGFFQNLNFSTMQFNKFVLLKFRK